MTALLAAALDGWAPTAGTWSAWSTAEPVLAVPTFADLRHALMDDETTHDRKDELLAALIRLAARDVEAITAVVACLLPGLKSLVRRHAAGVDRDELWSEVVGQVAGRVRSYRLDRRPSRIAANLLLDALSRSLSWARAERAWVNATTALDADAFAMGESLSVEPDPLSAAVRQRVVAPLDAVLIDATRLRGHALATAATLCNVSYEAAKKRRQRAEASLRRWLDQDSEATASGVPSAAA